MLKVVLLYFKSKQAKVYVVYFPRDPLLGLGGSGKEIRNYCIERSIDIKSENNSLLASRLRYMSDNIGV